MGTDLDYNIIIRLCVRCFGWILGIFMGSVDQVLVFSQQCFCRVLHHPRFRSLYNFCGFFVWALCFFRFFMIFPLYPLSLYVEFKNLFYLQFGKKRLALRCKIRNDKTVETNFHLLKIQVCEICGSVEGSQLWSNFFFPRVAISVVISLFLDECNPFCSLFTLQRL